MFCPRCGTQTASEQRFCRSCGFSLLEVRALLATTQDSEVDRSDAKSAQKTSQPQPSWVRWGFYIFVTGLAFLCVAGGFGLFMTVFGTPAINSIRLMFGLLTVGVPVFFIGTGFMVYWAYRTFLSSKRLPTAASAAPATQSIPTARLDLQRSADPAPSIVEHTTEFLPNHPAPESKRSMQPQ